MTREWQVGDVALVHGDVCVRCSDGRWMHGDERRFAHGAAATARPLVVIDPEDREQVDRLRSALFGNSAHAHGLDEMQDILREYAAPKPPKPEEPLGLGAVVEDAAGQLWVNRRPTWARAGAGWVSPARAGFWDYADIDAVRVLSTGVTE